MSINNAVTKNDKVYFGDVDSIMHLSVSSVDDMLSRLVSPNKFTFFGGHEKIMHFLYKLHNSLFLRPLMTWISAVLNTGPQNKLTV